MGCGRNKKKRRNLYIYFTYICWIGSSRFTHVVKKGRKTVSQFKGASVFRACESHCPTILSHNDYLAQSVPNYIHICACMYARV